mgnify:CR=1 FL=1
MCCVTRRNQSYGNDHLSAVFAVLLIFFLGDLVGALTKAKISPMFVIMMGFLVLFMTGIYPDNVMEISGFAGVASLGQYFLLFNMGTSVDIPTLKREWRTVLCATVGMAAAMMLRYSFGMAAEADAIENAVNRVLDKGLRTADNMSDGCTCLGCTAMGDAILAEL